MRRSYFAVIGVAAAFILAACTPDQTSDRPLTPTDPLLAPGGGSKECSGNLASDIAKNEKLLFVEPGLTALQDQFTLIKNACVADGTDATERAAMMGYFDLMIENRTATNAPFLADHLNNVATYAKGSGLGVASSVFRDSGGAAVLTVTEDLGDAIITFDKGARLAFDAGTDAVTPAGTEPFGTRFFTFEPLTAEECGDFTGLRSNARGAGASCYDIKDYPHATEYTPAATLTLCQKESDTLDDPDNDGIVHQRPGYGDEVLPPKIVGYSCSEFHAGASASWLERKGGPLGRALAGAYRFLAPKTLNADDVGESGSIGLFSKVGGVLNDIFADDFNDAAAFNPNPGADSPDLGDADDPNNAIEKWIYTAQAPGYIRIQDAIGDLTGGVLVLSQGQGACTNCPVFRLLGEIRTDDETINNQNETDYETNGSFAVVFTSLQNKPSVKEAPFVLLNGGNGTEAAREIVRLSYVTQSSQNRLQFKIPGSGNTVNTINVGTWVQNVSQTFKITVNLNVLNDTYDKTVSLAIWNPANPAIDKFEPVAGAQNIPASRATSFKHLGYILSGIDAGIIGSDNWVVTRLPDIPPP